MPCVLESDILRYALVLQDIVVHRLFAVNVHQYQLQYLNLNVYVMTNVLTKQRALLINVAQYVLPVFAALMLVAPLDYIELVVPAYQDMREMLILLVIPYNVKVTTAVLTMSHVNKARV